MSSMLPAHVYGFGALASTGSSVHRVSSVCDDQVSELQGRLRAARRVEVAIILGGASVSIAQTLLDAAGYRRAATILSVTTTALGALYAAGRLLQDEPSL
jgi:hypothetical protein